MGKELHLYTKEELISIIQDYQEMTSEIEEAINEVCRHCYKKDEPVSLNILRIRSIIAKYM